MHKNQMATCTDTDGWTDIHVRITDVSAISSLLQAGSINNGQERAGLQTSLSIEFSYKSWRVSPLVTAQINVPAPNQEKKTPDVLFQFPASRLFLSASKPCGSSLALQGHLRSKSQHIIWALWCQFYRWLTYHATFPEVWIIQQQLLYA